MPLLDRLRAATEGSRELDAEIAVFVGAKPNCPIAPMILEWTDNYVVCPARKPGNAAYVSDAHGQRIEWGRSAYTTSIDAALTLLDRSWMHEHFWDGKEASFRVWLGGEHLIVGRAPTLPLATCISAVIAFDLTERQEAVDRFYWRQGSPCCAGCDWWRHMNSVYGDCTRSAPVSEAERWAMTGITGASLRSGAGHVVTKRDHGCGDFADTFNWLSLPPAYLRSIGYPDAPKRR